MLSLKLGCSGVFATVTWMACVAAVAQIPAQSQSSRNCAKYSEPRIAYLLGCCGDLELGYSGPPLPVVRSDAQRAKLALREINVAIGHNCADEKSVQYTNILLDRVGAYLLSASAQLDAEGVLHAGGTRAAAESAKKASMHLSDFVKQYPTESTHLWIWIAESFTRAGEPWKAIQFVEDLPAGCCDLSDIARVEGDLLFHLGIQSEAARSYMRWLHASDRPSSCSSEESLAHVSILKSRGFQMGTEGPKAVDSDHTILCGQRQEWMPYVRLISHHESGDEAGLPSPRFDKP